MRFLSTAGAGYRVPLDTPDNIPGVDYHIPLDTADGISGASYAIHFLGTNYWYSGHWLYLNRNCKSVRPSLVYDCIWSVFKMSAFIFTDRRACFLYNQAFSFSPNKPNKAQAKQLGTGHFTLQSFLRSVNKKCFSVSQR